VPEEPLADKVPVKFKSVNLAAADVVKPIDMALIVPAVAGLIVSVPVPVGAMEIAELAGFMLNAPSSVRFVPPPAPHCNTAVPLAVLNEPPPEPEASKYELTNFVFAVIVVPVIVLGVVPPITGGDDRSRLPPRVRLPELVTVPDKLMPETVPVPLTDVTVPVVGVAHDGIPLAKVKT